MHFFFREVLHPSKQKNVEVPLIQQSTFLLENMGPSRTHYEENTYKVAIFRQ
jgi:hypothetical protein